MVLVDLFELIPFKGLDRCVFAFARGNGRCNESRPCKCCNWGQCESFFLRRRLFKRRPSVVVDARFPARSSTSRSKTASLTVRRSFRPANVPSCFDEVTIRQFAGKS